MRKRGLASVVSVVVLLGLVSCDGCGERALAPSPAPSLAPVTAAVVSDPVVARVDGVEIHRSQVEAELTAALETRARADRPPGDVWRERKRAQLLDGLIEQELLRRAIADAQIVVDEAALEERVSARIEDTWKTEDALRRYLERVGKPMAQWREELRFEVAVERLLGDADQEPDEQAVRDFFEANQGRYMAQARVRLSVIVFRVPAGASAEETEAVRRRAQVVTKLARQPGARFDELARTHGEGPTAAQGGALGWSFRRDLEERLAAAAFSLPVGAVSEPLRTRLGYEVVKIEERREAGVRDLEEVRPVLVAQLRQRRRQAAKARLLAELEERYRVERVAPARR